jgi:hypothetical protein
MWHRATELAWQCATSESTSDRDARIHMINMAIAIRALLRIASVSGAVPGIEDAQRAFEAAAPRLRDIRDVLEHLDEYRLGTGNLQRAGDLGQLVLTVHTGAGHRVLRLGDDLELTTAVFPATVTFALALIELIRPGEPIDVEPRAPRPLRRPGIGGRSNP